MNTEKQIISCYFSPCGNVKKTVDTIGRCISKRMQIALSEQDITLPAGRCQELTFGRDDIVILGVPVYAGRVPNKIMPYIRDCIHADATRVILVVSYGNRAFGDALSELKLLTSQNGFVPIAAVAMVSEHSFAETLATGRPDKKDLDALISFSESLVERIQAPVEMTTIVDVPGNEKPDAYYVPLKEDHTPARFLKAKPMVTIEHCNKCFACATVCPMGSIDKNDPSSTDGICIKCQACIKVCPQKARYFADSDFLSHREMLIQNYRERKEPEFF